MFQIPDPTLQINFAQSLAEIRGEYLQEALAATVQKIDIIALDQDLARFVPKKDLALLATYGLRAELMFPVPLLLQENPRLIGYYRLLYGYSQKEFYRTETGLSRFHAMEKKGTLSKVYEKDLAAFCTALIGAGSLLLAAIGSKGVTKALLDDLTLLTLGPQLRGGANVKKGATAIVKVFNAIHDIVKPAIKKASSNHIEIENAAGRCVLIEFASDPDIIIREEMSPNQFRELIAVEVKGGADFANIHNRIGEAEKSHQKAKARGYVECWTVVNVDRIDLDMAKRESPTTHRFYRLSDITNDEALENQDFRARIVSLTGIKGV